MPLLKSHNTGEYAGGVQDNGTMYGNASVINNFTRIYGGDGFTVQYDPNPSLVYTETQYGNIVFDDMFPTGNWQSIDIDQNQSYNWHTPYFISKHSSSTVFYAGQEVMRIDADLTALRVQSVLLSGRSAESIASALREYNQSV